MDVHTLPYNAEQLLQPRYKITVEIAVHEIVLHSLIKQDK
jgi:hypothetical protein